MQQDITNNYVMAEFYICAPKLEFDKIDKILNINNREIRNRETFKFSEFAKDYWSITTGYENSVDVNVQLSKIHNQIFDKVEKINFIRELYNADIGFLITIKYSKNMMLPTVYFENDFVKFSAKIGADINVDFVV